MRFVPQSEFLRSVRGAVVIAEENDFNAGMKSLPGLQRVPLDDGGMAAEGFGGGENG